jgi:hypothetical protein
MSTFEADDVIATLAVEAEKRGLRSMWNPIGWLTFQLLIY